MSPRRLTLLAATVVVALALVAAALAAPLMTQDADPEVAGGRSAADVPATLDAVRTYPDLRRDHVDGDVDYPVHPAAGGPHAPAWLDCGVYDVPVREENVVHDLEHGTLWISYDPALGADGVAALRAVLPDNGILAPYPGLSSPVVLTVWGAQLALEGADDPRLPLFLDAYGHGETSPEPGTSCHGGLTDPQGGVEDGGSGDGSGGSGGSGDGTLST